MTSQAAAPRTFRRRVDHTREQLRHLRSLPITTYYLIAFATVLLVAFGLIMVLSASSITAYAGGEGNSFTVFLRQAAFAVAGLVGMWVVSFARIDVIKKATPAFLAVAVALQVLPLTPLGVDVNGNRSWFEITSGFRIQPAEIAKLALPLYIGLMLSRKQRSLRKPGAVLPPLLVMVASIGLVILGHDVGTALVVFAAGMGALLVGGLPWRWIIGIGAIGIAGAGGMVLTSANRLARFEALITGHNSEAADVMGTSWQSNHGLYALASGGWLGVGLGASREKWSWLPEAHNDFIFAIIGEELGLAGAVAVIVLFVILGYGISRLVSRSTDRFVQASAAGIFGWFIGQAAINIAVVVGIAPVIGLPLPFVSYGGSSLVATLLAAGVLLAFARSEKGARSAMRRRAQNVRSSLSIVSRSTAGKD